MLAIGDGALEFWAALREVFPDTCGQRDWVHKTANVLTAMAKPAHSDAKAALAEIWGAEDKRHAYAAAKRFDAAYGAKFGKATAKITDDLDVLFSFYDFPAEHWIHLRTSNPIESTFALATAVGIPQGRLSEILKGSRTVTALEVFERIADGLTIPDHARLAMGLAPRRPKLTGDAEPSLGEIVDVFHNQAEAGHDIRASARDANHIDVVAVRGLGLVGLKDALLHPEIAGTFLEVETLIPDDGDAVQARQAVAAVLADLGLDNDDLEPTFYVDLVRSARGKTAPLTHPWVAAEGVRWRTPLL